jgi:hypothetical protein
MVTSNGVRVAVTIVIIVCAVPAAANDCPRLEGWWPYGPALDVETAGGYAYFGSGRTLFVADMANPGEPRVVAELGLPGPVGCIVVEGEYAYVSAGGLRVIDISNPEEPVEVGSAGGAFTDMAIVGGYGYGVRLGYWFGYFLVFDLSDPTAPFMIDESMNFYGCAVAASGQYLYVGGGNNELTVFDISTPGFPVEVGGVGDPTWVSGMTIEGGYLYAAGWDFDLRVFDISDPIRPIQVGGVEEPGGAVAVAISGNHAYVWDDESIVRVIDVSDPANPVEVGHVASQGFPAWYPAGMSISGETVLLADYSAGVRVIDVSIPESPFQASLLSTPGNMNDLEVHGGLAFVAESNITHNVLRVLDLSAGRIPVTIGSKKMPDDCYWLDVSGDLAYVGCYDKLRIYDVARPERPKLVSSTTISYSACGVEVVGDFAYLGGCYSGGLSVVDVSRPRHPVQVGYVDTPRARDLAVRGDLAVVPCSDYGVQLIDVSVPEDPIEVGRLTLQGGYGSGVAISGDYAYLAARKSGLQVIDISSPEAPVLVSATPTGSYTYDVAVSRGLAYVVDSPGGLWVFDVTDPTAPVECGSDGSNTGAYEAEIVGERAHVIRDFGFDIYDISACAGGDSRRPPRGWADPR